MKNVSYKFAGKLRILILSILLTVTTYAGTFNLVQEPLGTDQGLTYPSLAYGDYDNDGDLDIAITGSYEKDFNFNYIFRIYRNDGGTFTNVHEPMGVDQGVYTSSIAFGDIDNDGDLDIAITGANETHFRFIIYRNDGGTFTNIQEPMGENLGIHISSIAFEDIDNDGDLDLAVTGFGHGGTRFIIYRNDGGTFTNVQEPMGTGQGVRNSSIAFGDIDNDGDIDIAITGFDVANRRFIIFQNNDGTFTKVQEPMGIDQGVYLSSIAFGDYDNDGDLDLAVTGWDKIYRRFIIFQNNGGTFTKVQEPMGENKGVYWSSIAFGDYDNDGDLDLAVTGVDNEGDYRFIIFQNDTGTFSSEQEPIGANNCFWRPSIAFGDIDNDGDLDISVVGGGGDEPSGRFLIYANDEENTSTNNSPSVPTGMSTTDVGGYWKLSWNQSTDDHTNQDVLRYQIAIGTSPNYYNYTSTSIDYPQGQANLGNVMLTTGIPNYQTKIPSTQQIYWKVCAIDSAFKNSDYCLEQKFVISISGTTTDGTNPLPGVTVNLTGDSTSITITDASGNYAFNNLDVGSTYIVTPLRTHCTFSPLNITYIDLNSSITDADFISTCDTYSISGIVTNGVEPLSGITVNLTGDFTGSTVTDNSGNYAFHNIIAGYTYIITPANPHYTFSPLNRTYVNLTGDINNADFSGVLHQWSISGTITDGANPFQNVTVNLTGDSTANTTTNSSGSFTFNNLDAGCVYTVTPIYTDYNFTPVDRSYINLSSDITNADFTGNLNKWAISGTITDGTNPVSGVTVDLTGDYTASTITNASGNYTFNNLDTGATYVVTPTKINYILNPVNRIYTNLSNDITDADFSGTKIFAENLENIIAYPNPYKPDMQTDSVTFANLTENVEIKIFNIAGDLVFEIKPDGINYKWYLKNNNGEKVSSGVYIYLISNNSGEKKTGKFVIIR